MAKKKAGPLKRKRDTTFGAVQIGHISPPPEIGERKGLNLLFTFEEALKLHLAIGQAVAELNRLDRRSARAKAACVNLCVFPHDNYMTVTQDRLRAKKTGGDDASP